MSQVPVVVISEPGRSPLHIALVAPLEVGRAGSGVLVDDPAVSRRHVELTPHAGAVTVADLGSANGTTIDGQPLTAAVLLAPGSVVRLGDTTIILSFVDTSTDATPAEPDAEGLTTISRLADDVAASSVRPPDSMSMDGTVTIAFTDIESSTQLAHDYGDERWYQVLSRHAEVIRTETALHAGVEIKNQGDGFMLAFDSAHRAVTCLIAVQQSLASIAHAEPNMAITIRAGAHTGEVIVDDDGDLFGHHVNVAARIADQAAGGEIVVSSLVREIVESRGDLRFAESRTVSLKGLAGTYLIHPVIWQDSR